MSPGRYVRIVPPDNIKMDRTITRVWNVALGNIKMKRAKTTVRNAAPGNSKTITAKQSVPIVLQASNTTPRKLGVPTALQESLMMSPGRNVRNVAPENSKLSRVNPPVRTAPPGNPNPKRVNPHVQTVMQARNPTT